MLYNDGSVFVYCITNGSLYELCILTCCYVAQRLVVCILHNGSLFPSYITPVVRILYNAIQAVAPLPFKRQFMFLIRKIQIEVKL